MSECFFLSREESSHYMCTERQQEPIRKSRKKKNTEDWILGVDITALFFCSTSKKYAPVSVVPSQFHCSSFTSCKKGAIAVMLMTPIAKTYPMDGQRKMELGAKLFSEIFRIFFFVELYFLPKNQNIILRTWSYRTMYVIRDLRKSSGPTLTENSNTKV